eukprot:gene14971-biopygen12682
MFPLQLRLQCCDCTLEKKINCFAILDVASVATGMLAVQGCQHANTKTNSEGRQNKQLQKNSKTSNFLLESAITTMCSKRRKKHHNHASERQTERHFRRRRRLFPSAEGAGKSRPRKVQKKGRPGVEARSIRGTPRGHPGRWPF